MVNVHSILSHFEPVSLSGVEQVKLMTRMDRKYWFHISRLDDLLTELKDCCDVLEVSGERLIKYQTTYFDTPADDMYLNHHNGKLARYKVRRRKYETSALGYFEIKRKNNKRITQKKRIETNFCEGILMPPEYRFLTENAPYSRAELTPVISNSFSRMTLIGKSRKDRITIDLSPSFWNSNKHIGFNNLVVFELKRGSQLNESPVVGILKKKGIRHRGLSKYCTGRALLDDSIKKNAFKPRLRYLEKITKNKT